MELKMTATSKLNVIEELKRIIKIDYTIKSIKEIEDYVFYVTIIDNSKTIN